MEYRNAEAVRKVMEEIREEFHLNLRDVRIECVFTEKVGSSGGRQVWAKAKKVSGLAAFFVNSFDRSSYGEASPFFVLEVAEPAWDGLNAARRRALVDHELSHMSVDPEKDTLSIVGHDITEFQQIVARHGLWNEDLEDFASTAEQLSLLADGVPVHPVKRDGKDDSGSDDEITTTLTYKGKTVELTDEALEETVNKLRVVR